MRDPHDPAHAWLAATGRKAFATCPLTENGRVRIVGNPTDPNSPGPPHGPGQPGQPRKPH